ncbi:hypothetical protein [Alloactinosynnema sp. L-07]|nr:hypothetical protein [Alloactinosynnema sp. L-07]
MARDCSTDLVVDHVHLSKVGIGRRNTSATRYTSQSRDDDGGTSIHNPAPKSHI